VLTTLVNTLYYLSTQSMHWLSAPLIELIPLLVHFCNESQEEELSSSCQAQLIRGYAPSYISDADARLVIDVCGRGVEKCSWWKAKLTLLRFLQVFIFSNQFSLMEQKAKILSIVFNLMTDPQFDVRVTAAETLCGLIHCAFIEVEEPLIVRGC